MSAVPVAMALDGAQLDGDLAVPDGATGVVVFAHGSGSSRRSARNREVASGLRDAGLATLLFDLLTAEEERVDLRTREHRFDIDLLAGRLAGAVRWVAERPELRGLPVGCFGASTGAAAALRAAADLPELVRAVVSRGGRPDLAVDALDRVACPVLLVVGGADAQVLHLNRQAATRLHDVDLQVVPGAGHLFEEAGALEQVTRLAAGFLGRHLRTSEPA